MMKSRFTESINAHFKLTHYRSSEMTHLLG
jgi:hypothetical protein